MKKKFGIILIVSVLAQSVLAQDTMRACIQTAPLYSPSNTLDIPCPSGGVFIRNRVFYNGSTYTESIVDINITSWLGTQGQMDFYCDRAANGLPPLPLYLVLLNPFNLIHLQ